jgi:hypothetical protein
VCPLAVILSSIWRIISFDLHDIIFLERIHPSFAR